MTMLSRSPSLAEHLPRVNSFKRDLSLIQEVPEEDISVKRASMVQSFHCSSVETSQHTDRDEDSS